MGFRSRMGKRDWIWCFWVYFSNLEESVPIWEFLKREVEVGWVLVTVACKDLAKKFQFGTRSDYESVPAVITS